MRFSSFSTILSPLWNTGRQSLTSAISVIVVLAACTGCHQNLVVEAPNPVEIDRIEYTRIYNAAVDRCCVSTTFKWIVIAIDSAPLRRDILPPPPFSNRGVRAIPHLTKRGRTRLISSSVG